MIFGLYLIEKIAFYFCGTRDIFGHIVIVPCVCSVCDWAERSKKCACTGLQRRAYDPCWCWWHSTCRMQSNESCVYLSYLSQFLGYMVFKGCVPIKVDHPWNEKKMSLNLHWQFICSFSISISDTAHVTVSVSQSVYMCKWLCVYISSNGAGLRNKYHPHKQGLFL